MIDIHTDVSGFQVGLVISQLHRLIEFYRHKLTGIQMRYGRRSATAHEPYIFGLNISLPKTLSTFSKV